MSDSNKQRIKELIQEINSNCKKVQSDFWKFNRTRFLEIDDLGGHTILGYKHDKDFIKSEFPEFHPQWIIAQRTAGRIEQAIGIPVGTISINYIEPLRQFYVRKNLGQSNKGSGTQKNKEGEQKIKEAWAIACTLAAPNPPSKKHIESAVDQMAAEGKAKPRVSRSTMEMNRRYRIKNQLEQLEFYQSRCQELEQENQNLKAELQNLKSQFRNVA